MQCRRPDEPDGRLVQRRKGEKHVLSVQEYLLQQESDCKKPKLSHTRVRLEGFEPIFSGTFSWHGTGAMTQVRGLGCKPSVADIWLTLVPDAVIEKMLDHSYKNSVKGAHRVLILDVHQHLLAWIERAPVER